MTLVLCADDYALHAGVSEAVLDLARAGRLSATSAMVLSPRWADDAPALRELRGRIDVGLHLDWTSDFARAAGHGTSLTTQMRRALWHAVWPATAVQRAAVRGVIERQLDAFERHWQAAPDHVDGHQHVQQFPVIREALVDTLIRRYPAAHRPWLRVSQVPSGAWDIKAKIINAMGAQALLSLAQAQGLAHSQHLTGVYDFSGDVSAYRHRLQQWLTHLPTGAVLMCHPGTDSDPGAPYAQARPQEQQVLREAALQDRLSRQQIRIVRGTALFTPRSTQPTPQHDH